MLDNYCWLLELKVAGSAKLEVIVQSLGTPCLGMLVSFRRRLSCIQIEVHDHSAIDKTGGKWQLFDVSLPTLKLSWSLCRVSSTL